MNIGRMKISDLRYAEYNPRVALKPGMDEYEKIKKNIIEFGFVEPVIVNDRTGNIVGGHQRVSVLKDIGYDEVDVVHVDMDLDHEKALNIALNKITGKWDNNKLIKLIDSIDVGDVQFTGFSDIELSGIKASLGDIPTFSLDLDNDETNNDEDDEIEYTEEYEDNNKYDNDVDYSDEADSDEVDEDNATNNDIDTYDDEDVDNSEYVDIDNNGEVYEDSVDSDDIDNPPDMVMVSGETSKNWMIEIVDHKSNLDDIAEVLSNMGFELKIGKSTSTLIDGDTLDIEGV